MSQDKKQNTEKSIVVRMSNEMLEGLDRHAKELGGMYRTHLIKMVLQEWMTKRDKENHKDK